MRKFLFVSAFIFPFFVFGQWVDALNNSSLIFLYTPFGDEIPVTKSADTISFDQWMKNLKKYGIPELGYTVDDIAEIFSYDPVMLSQAYKAACEGCTLKRPAISEATIEFPEMNILYRGFDNVFKVAANWPDGMKEYRIEATDATVKTIIRNNQIMHTINPKGKTSEVKVIYKNFEGIEQEFGPWIYAVKMLPKPQVTISSISKSKGGIIQVAMPEDFFIGGINFQVNKLEVNGNTIIEGNVISPDVLKKIKLGKTIPLIVNAMNLATDEEVVINGFIELTE
jgi:hypothetical protein